MNAAQSRVLHVGGRQRYCFSSAKMVSLVVRIPHSGVTMMTGVSSVQ